MHSHFSLSWDSYKTSICNGFSTLQQNGEFVDMTIAAEGHFVKVHQMIVALASPYLKELITSAQCQHPVIFLNNVSHKVLCLLLEYMYTGEAIVPADCLSSFAETAKALHIRGLESIASGGMTTKLGSSAQQLDESDICPISGQKRRIISASDNLDEVGLPVNATKIFIKRGPSITNPAASNAEPDDLHDYQDLMDDSNMNDSDDGIKAEDDSNRDVSNTQEKPSSKLQFTVSIRGSLQLILNRFMYNLNSTTRTGHRRWRCVDYRNNKCTAYVTTKGNVVLNRANLHNHSFHDKKILSKIEKKAVYSAIEEAESYKENERNANKSSEEELSIEKDSFMTLEELGQSITGKSSSDMEMKVN